MKKIRELLPNTKEAAVRMYVYFGVFTLLFLIFLYADEQPVSVWAFVAAALARMFENLLSEAWQLATQKKSDEQEEILNVAKELKTISVAVQLKVDQLIERGKHLPVVATEASGSDE